MEGFPTAVKPDLRYYLDSHGRFTTRLRSHYQPARFAPDRRRVFIKAGPCWMAVDFYLLVRGSVFRIQETDGTFETWQDDGSDLLFAMENARPNDSGVWGVKVRKPTPQEVADA